MDEAPLTGNDLRPRAGKLDVSCNSPGDFILVLRRNCVHHGSVFSSGGFHAREKLTLGRGLAWLGAQGKRLRPRHQIYGKNPDLRNRKHSRRLPAIKKNQRGMFYGGYDIIEVPEAGMFSASRLPTTLMGAVSGAFNNAITASGQILPTRVLY